MILELKHYCQQHNTVEYMSVSLAHAYAQRNHIYLWNSCMMQDSEETIGNSI